MNYLIKYQKLQIITKNNNGINMCQSQKQKNMYQQFIARSDVIVVTKDAVEVIVAILVTIDVLAEGYATVLTEDVEKYVSSLKRCGSKVESCIIIKINVIVDCSRRKICISRKMRQ